MGFPWASNSMHVWKMRLSPDNFTVWFLGVSICISTEMVVDECIFTIALSGSRLGWEPGYGRASTGRGGDHVPLQPGLPRPLEVILSQKYRQSEDHPHGQTLNRFVSAPV